MDSFWSKAFPPRCFLVLSISNSKPSFFFCCSYTHQKDERSRKTGQRRQLQREVQCSENNSDISDIRVAVLISEAHHRHLSSQHLFNVRFLVMFLGSEHCPDSLSIKPALLRAGSFAVIAFFSAFTGDVSSSPRYCTFVFTVKTEWVPSPKSLTVGTDRYYWSRQTILKSIRLEYLKMPPQETHQLRVVYWATWNELLDVVLVASGYSQQSLSCHIQ